MWESPYCRGSDRDHSVSRAIAADANIIGGAGMPLIAPLIAIVREYRDFDYVVAILAAQIMVGGGPRLTYDALSEIYMFGGKSSLYAQALRRGDADHLRCAWDAFPTWPTLCGADHGVDVNDVFAEAVALGRDDVVDAMLRNLDAIRRIHGRADLIPELLGRAMDEKRKAAAIRGVVECAGLPALREMYRRPLTVAAQNTLIAALDCRFATLEQEMLKLHILYTLRHCYHNSAALGPTYDKIRALRYLKLEQWSLACLTCGAERPLNSFFCHVAAAAGLLNLIPHGRPYDERAAAKRSVA